MTKKLRKNFREIREEPGGTPKESGNKFWKNVRDN